MRQPAPPRRRPGERAGWPGTTEPIPALDRHGESCKSSARCRLCAPVRDCRWAGLRTGPGADFSWGVQDTVGQSGHGTFLLGLGMVIPEQVQEPVDGEEA